MFRLFVIALFVSSCSSTDVKKIGSKSYKSLAKDAPVQVFSRNYPDLGYEEICKFDLERNTSFSLKFSASDYDDDLREQARKCGANGVLVNFSSRLGNKISISATGIKIISEEKKIPKEDIKKLSLAVQSNNLGVLKKLLLKVNMKRHKRAPSDTEIIDGLFYVYSRKGNLCKSSMVGFFESYEAVVPKFNYIKLYGDSLSDENLIFCKNVLVKSFPKIQKKEKFAIDLNNHFVRFMRYLNSSDKNLVKKLDGYNRIFSVVTKEISKSCAKDETSELCIMKSNFADYGSLLKKAMIQLRSKTKSYDKLKELDKNFKAIII